MQGKPLHSSAHGLITATVRAVHWPKRLGAITQSLLATVSGGVLLLTAAAVLDPATLQARSPTSAIAANATRTSDQRVLESLVEIISGSQQVLAIRDADSPRGRRGTEVILWLHDARDHGHINASELAVIRHSPLFQTITLYMISQDAGQIQRAAKNHHTAWRGVVVASPGESGYVHERTDHEDNAATSRGHEDVHGVIATEFAAPGFIDRWRAMSAVEAKVIATGISDLRIEAIDRMHTAAANGKQQATTASLSAAERGQVLSLLRIALTSAGHLADDAHTASALVHAGRSRSLSASTTQEYTP